MVVCIIALAVFSVLGLWSAKYRRLAKEAFDCTFRMITLRPCVTKLDERIKSKVTAKLMRFPTAARAFYKYFKVFSWIFVISFFASMAYSAYGIYNLIVFGSCQPGGNCIFSQESVLVSIISCNEAKIVYTIIIFVTIALLTIKYLNNKVRTKTKYLVGTFLIAAFVITLYLIINVFFAPTQPSNQYDNFAKCLTEKGATFYGTYWCPHCTNQKNLFGSSLKYVNYVECDPKGENAKPEICTQNNIRGYPTWIINGIHYEGEQSFQQLSSYTRCPLP
jgi:glutaredoxin